MDTGNGSKVTLEQAMSSNEFHDESRACSGKNGPLRWRRNGRTQTWKTRPGEFRVPVKHGLYSYGHITETTRGVHAVEACSERKRAEEAARMQPPPPIRTYD